MTYDICKVGIIGLGLIGGSIARALKRSGSNYVIKAWDKDSESVNNAVSDKIIDVKVSDLSIGFSDCETVFLCIPVYAMKSVLSELTMGLSPNCILTDVGSTKGDVMSLVHQIGLKQPFIGGHPLAGSENSGYSASNANLFENAYYCITPAENTNSDAVECLKLLIQKMGAIPLELTPEEHDRATAAISHVPHVVAALLVNLITKLDGPQNVMKTIAAGGFKDITRIASSSPDLWTGICISNKDIILETLNSMGNVLKDFETDLRTDKKEGIKAFFSSAREVRKTFSDRKSLIQKTFDITVDVDDRPGIIAVIATALANENINIKNVGILNNREAEEGALQIQFENGESRKRGIDTLNKLGYRARERG
jgi:prephenate dehydrogenase